MKWNVDSERNLLFVEVMTGYPDAIERSEARGQKDFCSSRDVLPKKCLNKDLDLKKKYEELGIEILGDRDDIFYSVKIPESIELKPSDSSTFWNSMVSNGVVIAEIFFKASVYDYNSHIHFS